MAYLDSSDIYGALIVRGDGQIFGNLEVQGLINLVGGITIGGSISVAGITASGALAVAGNTTLSGGLLSLNNATSNTINFNSAGIAVPSFTTRSLGTKVVLYGGLSATVMECSIGVESGAVWYATSQATSAYSHKFYAGTTELMKIRGDGRVGIGIASPTEALDVNGNIKTNGTLTAGGKRHDLGTSINWDAVGFINICNLHFNSHNSHWIGAGNAGWYTGVAVANNHDLLITTNVSDATYTRGITFAVDTTGAGNSGYRLGRWFSGTNSATSILQVDGGLKVAKDIEGPGGTTQAIKSFGVIVGSNDISIRGGRSDSTGKVILGSGETGGIEIGDGVSANGLNVKKGIVTLYEGESNGIKFTNGSNESYIRSITGKELVIYNNSEIRFSSSSNWQYNDWAGLKYDFSNTRLVIGGPKSTAFNSNANPTDIKMNFDGITGLRIGDLADAGTKLDVVGAGRFTAQSVTLTDAQTGAIFLDINNAGIMGKFMQSATPYYRNLIKADSTNILVIGHAGTAVVDGVGIYCGNSGVVNGSFKVYTSDISRFEISKAGNILVGVDLKLPNGVAINEFSIDATLSGNSDLAVPTEKAMKTLTDKMSFGLRANKNISGGGNITYDASGNLKWGTRFIVISNGRGSNFAADGYFDITMPASGTVITGVGGASNITVSASGILMPTWTALYYILPNGSGTTSLNANFRVVTYGADLTIPENWVLIALVNTESGALKVCNGVLLQKGETWNSGYSSINHGHLPLIGGTLTGNMVIDKNTPRIDFMSDQSATNVGGRIEHNENGDLWVNVQGGRDLWLNWLAPTSPTSFADLQVGDGNSGSAILTVQGSTRRVGVNTIAPTVELDITGAIKSSGAATFGGLVTAYAGVSVTGNITVTGTVDGRDVSEDGTKLDVIEGIRNKRIRRAVTTTVAILEYNGVDGTNDRTTTALGLDGVTWASNSIVLVIVEGDIQAQGIDVDLIGTDTLRFYYDMPIGTIIEVIVM